MDEARLFETAATGGDPVLVAHKVGHYIYMRYVWICIYKVKKARARLTPQITLIRTRLVLR